MYNNLLKELREEKELTMLQIASTLKIAKSTYSLWEEGKERIPLDRFIEICDFFNVSVDYLLGFTKAKNYPSRAKSFNKKKFAANIKTLRKEKNYTQDKFAKKLNLGRTTIINYEKGLTTPMLDHLIYLCTTYNISADYLLGRITTPKNLSI